MYDGPSSGGSTPTEWDFLNLTAHKWLDLLIELARGYRQSVGRRLPITGELGELLACKVLNLCRVSEGNEGYDAVDPQGRKFQIKARAPSLGVDRVDRGGRISRFHSFDFDYALLVLFDSQYDLEGIWEADVSSIASEQEKVNNPRAGIHVQDFIRLGTNIRS